MVVLSRLLTSDGLAFDPATGDTFAVNHSGRCILEAFRIGRNKGEIVEMLRDEFQISQEEADQDVSDFHGRLQHLRLVSTSSERGLP